MASAITLLVLSAMACGTFASDPDMLQDICVADPNSGITKNKFTCKPVDNTKGEDFFFAGLANLGNTNNIQRSIITPANAMQIQGLTIGVSIARFDYAPGGLNPPHTHPRATEIVFVLAGELDVGFITTTNVLISKKIKMGEVFLFPRVLVHFQKNNGYYPAAVIAGFNIQLPGNQSIVVTLFNLNPLVPNNV